MMMALRWTITVFAPHSKEYKSAVHEQTNIRLKQMQKGGRNNNAITAEELEAAGIKMLAKTTKDWNITFDGEQPKFTVASAQKLYEKVFWVREQIEEAVAETEVFTQD
jgi:glycine/serine hydroxymethyltransferase